MEGIVDGASSLPMALRLEATLVSLMFSASWMAESATSVGSLTFFGVFAMFSPTPLRLRARPFLQKPQAQGRIHNPREPQTCLPAAGSHASAEHPIG